MKKMSKEEFKLLLANSIQHFLNDRITVSEFADVERELNRRLEEGERAIEAIEQMYQCKYEPDKLMCIYQGFKSLTRKDRENERR